jgi:hypothetical protein
MLNAVFKEMSQALQRGREVEFPFGRLVRVKRSFGANWDSVGDWPANRKPFTVEHELDEAGDRLLNGPPASGSSAAESSLETGQEKW